MLNRFHFRIDWYWWLFFFWVLFFFRDWYVLSYTKVWELRSLVGGSREEQLQVLHPREQVRSLLDIRAALQQHSPTSAALVTTPDPKNAFLTNIPVQRALLYPWRTIEKTQLPPSITTVVELSHDCTRTNQHAEREVICWPLP